VACASALTEAASYTVTSRASSARDRPPGFRVTEARASKWPRCSAAPRRADSDRPGPARSPGDGRAGQRIHGPGPGPGGRGLPRARRATSAATERHSLSLGLRATTTASDSEPQGTCPQPQGTCPLSLLPKSRPAGPLPLRGPKHPPHTLAGTRLRQLERGRAQGSGSAARPFPGQETRTKFKLPHTGQAAMASQLNRHGMISWSICT
jgi:hypothetical protein